LVTDRPELVTPELTVTVVMRRRPSLE